MDIYLDGINGMEAAQKISGTVQSRFVFTTATREFAPEAFSLNAAHYLLKPLTMDAVREALRRCLPETAEKSDTKTLEIKTRQGNVPVPMDKITYIEVFNKVCVIHTVERFLQTYTSLDALFQLLDDSLFIRAQRSFIVNMKYIETFFFDHIVLQDGKEIMLSRNKRAELKNQYQQFLFHLARESTA